MSSHAVTSAWNVFHRFFLWVSSICQMHLTYHLLPEDLIPKCVRCTSSECQSTLLTSNTGLTPFTLESPLSDYLLFLRWIPFGQSPHVLFFGSSGIFGICLEKCLADNRHLVMLFPVPTLVELVPFAWHILPPDLCKMAPCRITSA